MQRYDSPVTVECQSKNPLEDSYLIVKTIANLDTTKIVVNHERDESLTTSAYQPFENVFGDFCPVVNTVVNEDTNDVLSRLKYKNDFLQENVEVLRDENELLRDTMEV